MTMNRRNFCRSAVYGAVSTAVAPVVMRFAFPTLPAIAALSSGTAALIITRRAEAIAPALVVLAWFAAGFGFSRISSALQGDPGMAYEPASGDDFHMQHGARTLADRSRGAYEAGAYGVVMEVHRADGRITLSRNGQDINALDVSEHEAITLGGMQGPLRPLIPFSARVVPTQRDRREWDSAMQQAQAQGGRMAPPIEYARDLVNPQAGTTHRLMASREQGNARHMAVTGARS